MRRSKRKAIQNTAAVPAVTISDLPNHITCDILSRLSLNSIFACKRVCKLWRDLTLEPYFAKLHLSRSPLSLISYCHGNDIDNSPSYFEILQLYDPLVLRRRDTTMKFRIDIYFPRIHMVASCNGSILLSNSSFESTDDDLVIIVCNPLRAQQFILPKPSKLALQTRKVLQLGFGYSPSTDRYKVLKFTRSNNMFKPCRTCVIFTIGIDDEWRSMGGTEQRYARIGSKSIFLNGALYWIGAERFIWYFDIEREHFRSFPLPSHIGEDSVCLEVLDNRLYLRNLHFLHVWKFWAMNDYGDFGSWTLEWVIEEPKIRKFNGLVRPLKMLKDGSLLMTFYDYRDASKFIIASYNPRTRVLKKNKYHFSGCWYTAVAGIPCFFSPMDALK